jgi:hypothetical protein
MMASGWTDEDSRAAAEKIIKRAEISKVLLPSRLEGSLLPSGLGSRVKILVILYTRVFLTRYMNNADIRSLGV